MHAVELFEGHTIEAVTEPATNGRWTWAYTIDGQHRQEGRESLHKREALALREALDAAHVRVTHWVRTKRPPEPV
jgi:hypothetical protein